MGSLSEWSPMVGSSRLQAGWHRSLALPASEPAVAAVAAGTVGNGAGCLFNRRMVRIRKQNSRGGRGPLLGQASVLGARGALRFRSRGASTRPPSGSCWRRASSGARRRRAARTGATRATRDRSSAPCANPPGCATPSPSLACQVRCSPSPSQTLRPAA